VWCAEDARGSSSPILERLVRMSGVSSVGSSVNTQQVAAQQAAQSKAASSKSAEEQAESPAQKAAENDGGGLNILA
jgi:hypothetical protein